MTGYYNKDSKYIRAVKCTTKDRSVVYKIQQKFWFGIWFDAITCVGIDTLGVIFLHTIQEVDDFIKKHKDNILANKNAEIIKTEIVR